MQSKSRPSEHKPNIYLFIFLFFEKKRRGVALPERDAINVSLFHVHTYLCTYTRKMTHTPKHTYIGCHCTCLYVSMHETIERKLEMKRQKKEK